MPQFDPRAVPPWPHPLHHPSDDPDLFRYVVDHFHGAGLDTHTQPPAQSPEMFEDLTNIMPVHEGILERRWGYVRWDNSIQVAARRMQAYFNEGFNYKQVVSMAGDGTGTPSITNRISIYDQAGALLVGTLFTPASVAQTPNMVMSRDWGFFTDFVPGDLLKYGGIVNRLLSPEAFDSTNWSKNLATVTPNNVTDPNGGSTADTLTSTGADSFLSQSVFPPNPVAGTVWTFSVYLKVPSGTKNINIYCGDNIGNTLAAITITTTWTRFNVTRTTASNATSAFGQIGGGSTWSTGDIHAWGAQLEASPATTTYFSGFGAQFALAKWGIAAPVTAVSVGAPVAGAITLTRGRNYYVAFRNATTGHVGGLSPISASTGPITAKNVPLSNIPTSTDGQVDNRVILATADGGAATRLYLLTQIADNSTTSFTDSTPEATLLTNNVYLDTDDFGVEHGIADNAPPPNGNIIVKHRGRLYMAGVSSSPHLVFFSKNIDDVTTSTGTITSKWEEAWPPDFFIDPSRGAEVIRGLLSDGQTLYIATERHIRRLIGDGPHNFEGPEVVFPETGLLNPDCWQLVFVEGQPVGTMWLTPDFRLMGSDFNTYQDVGSPIQPNLNNINTAQTSKIWARFFAAQEHDLFVLAVPDGSATEPNSWLVYSMRNRRWYNWTLRDNSTAGLFQVPISSAVPIGSFMWLFVATSGKHYYFRRDFLQDGINDTPANISCQMRTSWLPLGDPTMRKALNELEINASAPTGYTVTITGGDSNFGSPTTIVSAVNPVVGPIANDFKVYLAGTQSRFRYYRFQFNDASQVTNLLNGYSVEAAMIHRL